MVSFLPDPRGQSEYDYKVGCRFPSGFKESLKFINSMDISLRVGASADLGQTTSLSVYLRKPFYKMLSSSGVVSFERFNFGSYSIQEKDLTNFDIEADIRSSREFVINSSNDGTYFRIKVTDLNYDSLAPKNINLNTTDCLQNITLSWENDVQDSLTLKIFQGDVIKFERQLTNQKSVVIPPNTFKPEGISIQFIVKKTVFTDKDGDVFFVSNLQSPYTHRVNLTSSAVKISNINQETVYLDKGAETVKLSWNTQRQERYRLDINNQVYTGNKDEFCNVSINHINFGFNNARLTVYNDVAGNTYQDYRDFSFEVSAKEPKINEIETKEINIDKSTVIRWSSEKQEHFRININGSELSGNNEKSCKLNVSNLVWGVNNARLTIDYVIKGRQISTYKDFSFNVTANNPIVSALDPSNIDVNIDNPVTVTWRSVPKQSSFTLRANNNTYSGTSNESVNIPVGVFRLGNNSITIDVTRVVLGQVLIGSKTVYFNGYGKPLKPVFDNKNVYNTALPRFNWSSSEQKAFRFQIYDGSLLVKDSGDVVSANQYYDITQSLGNNKTYTIKLAIKNKFNLWSDFAQKNIRTSFETINPPVITLFQDVDGGIVINTTNSPNSKFAKSEVWRKDDFSDWKRIGYNLPLVSSFKDNTVASNITYYYKANTHTKTGGISEGEVKSLSIKINKGVLVDIETNEYELLGYSFDEFQDIKIQRIKDIQVVSYQGKKAPEIEIGELDYREIEIPLAFDKYIDFKRFEYFVNRSKLLMFKDSIGRKVYCSLKAWGDEQINVFGNIGISLKLVEVNFVESDIFDGNRRLRLIKTDDGWKFEEI